MGQISIINKALSKLGDMRVTSLDDDTKTAGLAASLYEAVRDGELEAQAWHFAKARAHLPAEAEKPAFGWAWQYLLPADCLRVLEVRPWPDLDLGDYAGGDRRNYELEGGRVLTNHGPALMLVYLRRVVDAAMYPPAFVEVLAAKLAVEMAESLTGSNSKRELAWKEYEMAVKRARRLNAIQLPPVTVEDDTWMLAHRTGVI